MFMPRYLFAFRFPLPIFHDCELRSSGLIVLCAEIYAVVCLRLGLGVWWSLTMTAIGATLLLSSRDLRAFLYATTIILFSNLRLTAANCRRGLSALLLCLSRFSLWSMFVATTVVAMLLAMWQNVPSDLRFFDHYAVLCVAIFACVAIAISQFGRLVGHPIHSAARSRALRLARMQFRLRSMLCGVCIICVVLAAWTQRRVPISLLTEYRRAQAIDEISRLDGIVSAKPGSQRHPADAITFRFPQRITDAELDRFESSIRKLPNLEEIVLDDSQITDAGFVRLASWNKKWRLISVRNTRATQTGEDCFLAICPECRVYSSHGWVGRR